MEDKETTTDNTTVDVDDQTKDVDFNVQQAKVLSVPTVATVHAMLVNMEQRQDHLMELYRDITLMQANMLSQLSKVDAILSGVKSLGERQEWLIESVGALRRDGEQAKQAFDTFMQGGAGKMIASIMNPLSGFRKSKGEING